MVDDFWESDGLMGGGGWVMDNVIISREYSNIMGQVFV